MIPLGAGGEFDRVRAIAAELGAAIGPIGDDTVVIPDARGVLVTSVDASIENVHFRRDWLAPEEIGWRSAAAALSDLAAAGASAVGVLAAVIVPRDSGEDNLVALMRGVGAVTASVGGKVLGGDLTSGSRWGSVITVFGRAERAMARSGAHVGDGVWVTGELGGARAALQSWTTNVDPDPGARERFARPLPRIEAGRWLAAHGATAMIDLSDGLGGDADHIAAASRVGIDLDLSRLPLHRSVSDAARRIGEEPAHFAANAGEDYELLVTLPASFDAGGDFAAACGVPLTRIGDVTAAPGVRAHLHGQPHTVGGFRHAL